MKKLVLFLIFLSLAHSKIITIDELKKDGFVLMLGWDSVYDDAVRIANKFPNDDIFIYLDNNRHTVRMVNIDTLDNAKAKLKEIKKVQKDAILWKKMGWLVDEQNTKKVPENNQTQQVSEVPNKIIDDNKTIKIDESLSIKEPKNVSPKVVVDFNTISNVLAKQLKADTISYTAPLPLGAKTVEFKKDLFVQGFFNKSTDWFIVVATSDDGVSWGAISVPVWINSSVFDVASIAQ